MIWTQASAARHHECTSRQGEALNEATSLDSLLFGKRILVTVPPFHVSSAVRWIPCYATKELIAQQGAGLCQYLLWAIPFGSIPIAPAAAGIVTAHGLVESLKQTPAQIAVLVPSVVAELAQNPDLLDYCASHLELILYIGGDLPQAIGDLVSEKIKLHCWWGASECGIPHQLIPNGLGRGDWRYIRFHPSVGAIFDPITEDTYELVIRNDEALPQTCFTIRGQEQLKEYRTKDLFTRHPTIEDSWCWRARADDIIVFLNGEKTNPVSMEQHIVATNPELSGALVVGAQRFQAALVIDPASSIPTEPLSTFQQAALIERIWPSVQEANKVAPAHARIEKSLILVTSPDRPFIRAGKGTIQRAASVAQYTADIETLYARADLNFADDETVSGQSLASRDAEAVARFIRQTVSTVTGWTEEDGDSASFFDRGMDSLQALQLTRALRRGLCRPDLGLPTIYNNPTVLQLTTAIVMRDENDANTDRDTMEPLLKTYKELIFQIPKPKPLDSAQKRTDPVNVVLTGSTGTIGTFLLRALLDRPGVEHVFCLNRGEDGGRASQEVRLQDAGLVTHDLNERVTFLKTDLASPHLGLEEAKYEHLHKRVGLIIHNAWPVNFNLGLPAFRPQLAGLVNLFALSAAAKASSDQAPHFVFISSVGAVGGLSPENGPAPEKILSLMDTPYPNGYARSKFLSELLCDAAAQHLGLPVTIARVGQVAGAVQRPGGIWNRTEWLPSLVISSVLRLGCLPDSLGGQFSEIDWVPSDLLADVVVDIATQSKSDGARVFNLRNPHPTTWESLLPAITEASKACMGREMEVVSPSAWLERLSDSERGSTGDGDNAIRLNPAIKLLDFYRNGLWRKTESHGSQIAVKPMAVDNASASSPTLRSVPPVNREWMRKWIDEWVGSQSGTWTTS